MNGRDGASRIVLNAYLLLFFAYLFLPLLIMVAAAFNDYPQPSVTVWRGFTWKWFPALVADQRMWQGLIHSLLIALMVIGVSVPAGLAGALLITRLESRFNGVLYGIMVSPILTPGIILGVSTLIFWRELGVDGGLFLAAIAQSTFIAAYCMLMFMARLQRQDRTLEEAALDLGASHFQVFRRITLPFLLPTVATAVVIAFLQSIENYNTTVFSIGAQYTLVTEIGSRLRFGVSPVVNVIGVIFIAITIAAASVYVVLRQREDRRRLAAG
ncbi:ABC transporter permease [Marinivivus vitaminiproducens]|uniref:ABC transporter permease n=1 Tax=Marinivivus vitaminiproducens TaxID=3035935 RepID=UPI0027A9E770|nr:ABC transporter permease [Geminicoccaceae bacterium SCSIO 64248]